MSQEIVLYHCSMLPRVAVCGVHCVAVRQCVAVCYTPASGHASLCSMSRCMNMYFSRCVCVHVGRCACICVYSQIRLCVLSGQVSTYLSQPVCVCVHVHRCGACKDACELSIISQIHTNLRVIIHTHRQHAHNYTQICIKKH